LRVPYPNRVAGWFAGLTFAAAVLLIVLASPPHSGNDPLFWLLCAGIVGLFALCVILHQEKDQKERSALMLTAAFVAWVLAVALAVQTLVNQHRV
jgi:hypothetical protein